MRILVYHPHGNQNVRGILNSFLKNDLLQKYVTSLAFLKGTFKYWIIENIGPRIFLRRTYDNSLKGKTETFPVVEIMLRLPVLRNIIQKIIPNEDHYLGEKACRFINSTTTGVYSYPSGSYSLFKKAKKEGKKCYYEFTIAYYKEIRAIAQRESEKGPFKNDIYTSDEEIANIDNEIEMADCIFVASKYVKGSLLKYHPEIKNIHIVPYGFPTCGKIKEYRQESKHINLLYVGNLSQIKGLDYLFHALEKCRDFVNLTLIGDNQPASDYIKEETKRYNYLGTQSHEEVLKAMRECDVFILPSLTDGYGLVVTEAMAQGTPCIVTDHCGASEIIENDKNGWVISTADSEAIRLLLTKIHEHFQLIEQVGKQAYITATTWSWDDYGQTISNIIMNGNTNIPTHDIKE